MTDKIHKASCMCGTIEIEASGKPSYAEYCHCITCQKSSGSSFMVWVVFDKENVKLTKGEISRYNSSPEIARGFCGNCGSNVSIHTEKCFDIPIGVLEKPNEIEITQHIWTKRALKHVSLNDDLPKYDQFAPD